MKKKSGRNNWADHYTRQAKKENYVARSVFKLKEIQKKFKVLAKGQRVLDLGCAPGSWMQYAAEVTSPSGRVVGIDLKAVGGSWPGHVVHLQGDVYDALADLKAEAPEGFNAVISDMAPATTGIHHVDTARSENLSRMALEVAAHLLVPGGNFICKIFQGPDFQAYVNDVRTRFERHGILKPQSTRKGSREIFIIGLGWKGARPIDGTDAEFV
ncbi:MAG: 50S rRNA methyltransferase [Deltaproteobacteria bacterium]|nr:MAG: 50S rRNA methyltransferase [Deltaproteobacteria bacterium]